jgi:hypothetical protein
MPIREILINRKGTNRHSLSPVQPPSKYTCFWKGWNS